MRTKWIWAVLLLVLVLLPAHAWAAAAPARPNVVFIISDDQAWADYSFMGHPQIRTPALDQLARESVVFERGYSPVPLCRPSLASIVTGKYPHQHGVTGNDPELPDKSVNAQAQRGTERFGRYYDAIVERFAREPNLFRDLTSRGYVSLQTGKWWEGDPVRSTGFTHAMTVGTGSKGRHGDAGLAIGREGLQPIKDFVQQASGQPFLVWYAPMLPHTPHNPPAELLRKYLPLAPSEPVARYWACVEWFDQTCGELLGYLDAQGLRTNTIVIYTTDNGWLQSPTNASQFAARSKLTPYEGGVRTPIMVSWPGRLAPRRDAVHLASNLDLWPTLAGLLGTPLPKGLPGINLVDEKAVQRRQAIFGEQYTHNIAELGHPERSLGSRWIIAGNWKLIQPFARTGTTAATELYDLGADPWENRNLAAENQKVVQRLQKQLDSWWKPQTP